MDGPAVAQLFESLRECFGFFRQRSDLGDGTAMVRNANRLALSDFAQDLGEPSFGVVGGVFFSHVRI
jgi:hypothetical protein